jgi:PAP2 superfamily
VHKKKGCRFTVKSTLTIGAVSVLLCTTLVAQVRSVALVRTPFSQQDVTIPAPNFRTADFDFEYPTANPVPDAPSSSEKSDLGKRTVIRFGQDQKRIYRGIFRAKNLKWDAVFLVGTGAFIAADRRIETNVSHSNFNAWQNTSDIAVGGLAASLAGVWLYGLKTNHPHARETGDIELETLINAFLIYTPMQLIVGRQRPDEGNGNGDFFKHHSINTSFPGGHAMFTWAMASVLADEYPKPWARFLSYGAAFTVTLSRFMARDHWSSDMFAGTVLGLGIAENTFHARCGPQFDSQCRHHRWWWQHSKIETSQIGTSQ